MTTITMPAKRFKALTTDLYSLADKPDEFRPVLGGTLFGIDPGTDTLNFFVTDSYILYRIELTHHDWSGWFDNDDAPEVMSVRCPWILPRQALYDFARGLKVSDPEVTIHLTDDDPPMFDLHCNGQGYKGACIEGDYPNMTPFLEDFEKAANSGRTPKAHEQKPVAVAPRYLKGLGSLKLPDKSTPVRMIGNQALHEDAPRTGWETRPTFFQVNETGLTISVILMPVRVDN